MVKLTVAHQYYKILLSYKKEEVLFFFFVLSTACGILTQQYRYCVQILLMCTLKMVKMANFILCVS